MRVVESKTAAKELDKIVEYLSQNFPINVLAGFLSEYDALVVMLSTFPNSYQKHVKEGSSYRRCVINKLTLVFYIVYPDRVVIRHIRDARSKLL